jgi:hypothetical protein
MAAYRRIILRSPFTLMGKGRDRGAESIKTNTPTFLLPRREEGNSALLPAGSVFISQPKAPSQPISKEHDNRARLQVRLTVLRDSLPAM